MVMVVMAAVLATVVQTMVVGGVGSGQARTAASPALFSRSNTSCSPEPPHATAPPQEAAGASRVWQLPVGADTAYHRAHRVARRGGVHSHAPT